MDVTVVGAGVIGLTTAITLEERGHRVCVVAAATGAATTSAVAAAVWFPYRCGPEAKVITWAARTRTWLEQLARETPQAGVDLLTCYEVAPEMEAAGRAVAKPWWARELDVELVRAPIPSAPPAWRFTAPRAQPSLFLAYLEARLRTPIERRVVTDLAAESGDVLVNCTGLGARELVGDERLIGLLGQIVIAEPSIDVMIGDDRDPDTIFYAVPRRDELVLGGCSLPDAKPIIDPAITERILTQARAHGLSIGRVRAERVGVRPYRDEVRLEREGRVIHCYGHGGAGFTLCRGCAEDVCELL